MLRLDMFAAIEGEAGPREVTDDVDIGGAETGAVCRLRGSLLTPGLPDTPGETPQHNLGLHLAPPIRT